MKFGEKLRDARKKAGLSQAELAEKISVTTRTIQGYESGSTYPRDRNIYKRLADCLDIDADFLHNENDIFAEEAAQKYGSRGKKQAEALMADVTGLFAGGEMADDDLDEFMRAVQEAYWLAKEENKKYARKKNAKKS